ncbi:hypothetical protein T10_6929 [Trichinella papuae]|uniref:Uncharacterized protein n=1 Tax=Trichinella papuae TaxID=268474 RepID=A0A0V1M3N5_9BILA|nr:hypothetical protein T10_6929 [Trichinella papuae]
MHRSKYAFYPMKLRRIMRNDYLNLKPERNIYIKKQKSKKIADNCFSLLIIRNGATAVYLV